MVFRARWIDSILKIDFEDCKISGLGNLDSLVLFKCNAKISAEEKHLIAEADMSLELKSDSSTSFIPKGLLEVMGEKALGLIIERLIKRCRGGLLRGVDKWMSVNC